MNKKRQACKKVNIDCDYVQLEEQTTERELLDLIEQKNNEEDTDGIMVQLPLPQHISPRPVYETISPRKNVEGLSYLDSNP